MKKIILLILFTFSLNFAQDITHQEVQDGDRGSVARNKINTNAINFAGWIQQLFQTHPLTNNTQYVFFSDTTVARVDTLGNIRIRNNGENRLITERYNGTVWEQLSVLGGSLETDELFLNSNLARLFFSVDTNHYNWHRASQTGNAQIIGDLDQQTLIASELFPQIIIFNGAITPIEGTIFTDSSETSSALTMQFTVPTTLYTKLEKLNFSNANSLEDRRFRILQYKDSARTELAWQSHNDADWASGVGFDASEIGGNSVILGRDAMYFRPNQDVYFTLQFNLPSGVKGVASGSDFEPKLSVKGVKGTEYDMADLFNFKFGRNFYYYSDIGENSATSSTLQNKLDITTSTLEAGTYRIAFHCEAANSSPNSETRVEYSLNGSAIHIHTNGGDYLSMTSSGSDEWINLDAVIYHTIGSPSTIDLNIKYAAGANTARISNAYIEIWRVE